MKLGQERRPDRQLLLRRLEPPHRLTAVIAGVTAQAGFTYDALGRRNLEWYPRISYAGNPLNVFTYFSPQGQAVEDHWGTSPSVSATYQYVWSLAYVNAMVERDDLTGNGPSRLYALQDANFNVTGIVDGESRGQTLFLVIQWGRKTKKNV